MEILLPIVALAIGVAIARVIGIMLAKPGKVDRVYTKPVISGSWGRQSEQTVDNQQSDSTPSEPRA